MQSPGHEVMLPLMLNMNTAAMNPLTNAWLPRAAEFVLVLVLAWVVAGWLTGGGASLAPVQQGINLTAVTAAPQVANIVSVPLFGKAAVKETAPKPAAPVAAAPTRLNIRLLGTVVAGKRSSAVMKLGSGKEKVVFVGDDIQPGVILERVETDAIIVDNRGRREKVLMAKGGLDTSAAIYAPAPQMPASGSRQFTRASIQKQMRDFPKLLTGVLAIPHQMNGIPDGFLIQDIVPGSLYEQAGLMNGDVIHRVNGQELTKPEQGISLFQALQKADSIDLEITRAGAVQRLHYDIH